MESSPHRTPPSPPFPLRTPARLGLCLVSVLLFRLAFPGGPFPGLVWVCLLPLSLAIHGMPPLKAGLWTLGTAAMGWLASVWWITVGLTGWVKLSPSAAWAFTTLFCLYAAVPYALSGGVWALCRRPFRLREAVFSAAFLTAAVSWFPQIFPGNPAHSLFNSPVPIQVLDLGGVPMLLFTLTLINRLLFGALAGWTARRGMRGCTLMLLLTVAAVLVYGHLRISQFRNAEERAGARMRLTVAAIQPDIPVPGREDAPPEDRQNDLPALFRQSELAATRFPKADLMVWPEIPVWVSCGDIRAGDRSIEALSRHMAMPVMTPCIQRVEDGDGVARYANSAVLIRPDGAHSPPYVKRILVPFSEYLPLEEALPFLRRLFPGAARYEAGKEMVLMDLPGKDVRVIPTICYESVFTRHIRKGVEDGGNLVVNMVDDAWFGPTAASAVHLALGVLRAVEYRVPLVRVTNSGDGVFVGASGRIVPGTRTPSFQTAITVRTLFTPDSRSPYARWGDAVLWGLTVLSGIGWVGLYLGRKGDGKLREADRRLI